VVGGDRNGKQGAGGVPRKVLFGLQLPWVKTSLYSPTGAADVWRPFDGR